MRNRWLFALVLLAVGAVARFAGLANESLWTDEMHTVRQAGVVYSADLPAWSPGDLVHVTQGPLFMLLVHGWSAAFGSSETALRVLPALFGMLTLPLMWAVGRTLLDERAAWIATALLALSPFHVWYSRELRGYSLVILAALLATWLWWLVLARLRERRPWVWFMAGYLAAAVIGLGASFSMVFVLAFHLVLAAPAWRQLARDRRLRAVSLLAAVVVVVIAWPWIETVAQRFDWGRLVGVERSQEPLRAAPAFALAAVPYTFFVFSVGFSLGPSLAELHATGVGAVHTHGPAIILVALAFGGGGLLGVWRLWRRDRRVLVALGLWLAIPMLLAAMLAIGEIKAWNPRYLGVSFPAFLMLIAAGVADRRRWQWAVLAAPVVLSAVSLWNLHTEPRYWKEDYRAAATYLDRGWQAGDALVGEGAPGPLFFYLASKPSSYVHIQPYRYPLAETARRLDHAVGDAERVWLVRTRAWQSEPELVEDHLRRRRVLADAVTLRGLEIKRFDRRP